MSSSLSEDIKNLSKLKVSELREKLDTLLINSTGNKNELIKKLTDYYSTLASNTNQSSIEANQAESVIQENVTETSNVIDVIDSIETVEAVEVVEDVKPLTDAEKALARANRFGVAPVISEADKKKQRAERFGLPEKKGGHNKKGLTEEDKEALAKRAERFGLPVTAATPVDEEALKKRAARFGVDVAKQVNTNKRTAEAIDPVIAAQRAAKFGDISDFVDMSKKNKGHSNKKGKFQRK